MKTYRVKEYKRALSTLHQYMDNKKDYAFIHYSCKGFLRMSEDKVDRILVICIHFPYNGSNKIFSLRNTALIMKLSLHDATSDVLDKVEAHMLDRYFKYAKDMGNVTWLHWNMDDSSYGFCALEERHISLGGEPFKIDERNRINVAILLKRLYGQTYASLEENSQIIDKGKLYVTLRKNGLYDKEILTLPEEAKAFDDRKYPEVETSTSAKVRAFSYVMDKAANRELLTNSNKFVDVYGISVYGVLQYVRDNALLAAIFAIIGSTIGSIIANLIRSL